MFFKAEVDGFGLKRGSKLQAKGSSLDRFNDIYMVGINLVNQRAWVIAEED